MQFVTAISQGFRTCLKSYAILLRQKLHQVSATKIACVNGPLPLLHDGKNLHTAPSKTNIIIVSDPLVAFL